MSLFEKNIILAALDSDDLEIGGMVSVLDENTEEEEIEIETFPILPLKNTVLYPGVVIPITIGRDKSLNAIKAAQKKDKRIAVLSQKNAEVENPVATDLFAIGTLARIIKVLKMPDGSSTAILQGAQKFNLISMQQEEPYFAGNIESQIVGPPLNELEFQATMSSIKDLSKKIIELSPNIPTEAVMMLENIKKPVFLLNFIASNLNLDPKQKQHYLSLNNLTAKSELVLKQLNSELQIVELKNKIESKVRTDIDKQQRDYFLNQQLKTIQEELGDNPQKDEIEQLALRAKDKKWPKHAAETFNKNLNKLRRLNSQMPDFSVTMTYLETLLDLPWDEYSVDNYDLVSVKKVLDKDHFGLDDVKERILEHLAVLKLKGDMKSPILCLVGPPGVGKTSLGKSIASALNREFIRMSLGGLHDESEIRGHRRTYIGAMPGRVIKGLRKAQSSNPVFILDEIDKIGKDFRGDPSSALLEVLDPEQNGTFHDNYLDLEYDLSKILFIATANSLNTIQPALRDRMEIIHISGYSEEEKIEIAQKYLISKQLANHGLKKKMVKLPKKTLQLVVQNYTKESGVRNLDRQIAKIMRYAAKKIALNEMEQVPITKENLQEILGPSRFSRDPYKTIKTPGVAVGLAWTQVGGDILFIESSLSPGKGKLTLTGNLGNVMKESASTALSYIKAHAKKIGIDQEKFEKYDIHIHVPEGAIPKDGPSAGITMLSALSSAFLNKKIRPYLAMTGEITLRGAVLPVGGIKEKILAAKRAGIKTVMMSEENAKHVAEINKDYIKDMSFHYVKTMDEVLDFALNY